MKLNSSPVRWAILALLAGLSLRAPAEELSQSAIQQITALRAEKETRTPAQQKMDSHLIYALKQSLNQPIAAGITNLQTLAKVEADGRVLVDIKATVTPALLNFITSSNGVVVDSLPQFQSVRARLPLPLTEALAARSDVVSVDVAVPAATRTGSVDSEGDTTHRAAEARSIFNANGLGVKVGVLSDSVDFLAQAQASGDLPPNVTVLPGQSGVPAGGEGTAMLEIVHDLAPGAQLFYATGFGGPNRFAQNILDLRAAGCDVIVDDIFYFNESPFQDAVIAQAVNAVTASGALYFSAAGNEGNLAHGTSGTWEGDFADGGPAGAPVNGKNGTLHSFGANPYDAVTGVGIATVLLWSDPLGGSANDYDLYVLDSTGANIVNASTTIQNGSRDPFEIVAAPRVGERIVVVKASGAADRFIHIDTLRGRLSVGTAGNITGHCTATNAFAVAAVDVHTAFPNPFSAANPCESFSTDGPRRTFYDVAGNPVTPGNVSSTGGFVRQKPDISAADGVVTTLPSNSGLNPFYGTSAAAPHAAAIAAILKSYNPNLTPAQFRTILTGATLDNEAAGYDITAGNGILMAYDALAEAPPPIPAPVLVLVTNFISGGNGNGVIDFRECNNLTIVITNVGRATATGVRASLTTTTPGVLIAQAVASFPDIGTNSSATNLPLFKISTAPDFICATPIALNLSIKCDQNTTTTQIQIPTGVPSAPVRFDNPNPVFIPDNNPVGGNSSVLVSNITSAVTKVTVSLMVQHSFASDLTLQLISPEGITNTLSAHNGFNGQNYGISCSPEGFRTTFDDTAATAIGAGTPPFLGSYIPVSPLSLFAGKSGTNVNGAWTLRVVDDVAFGSGILQCWSLFLTTAQCSDGGGECPGSELAIGMVGQPEPVLVGGLLDYLIAVTNRGPSAANNTVVTHVLPSTATFQGATMSQGGYSQNGGTVSLNFGTVPAGSRATATVTIQPLVQNSLISSTATASSSQQDPDTSNNSITVQNHVNPPTADITVGLAASPEPVVVGSSLVYTIGVTNNGPSPATHVTVTNILPPGMAVLSETLSQGSLAVASNVVTFSFGTLLNGAAAGGTITVIPTAQGVFQASARATADQIDPQLGNNSATVSSTVAPAADLALTLAASASSIVIGSNFTYQINVVNNGPNGASGVGLSGTFPGSLTVVSNFCSHGTLNISGGALNADLGSFVPGEQAGITLVLNSASSASFVSSFSVAGAQTDPNLANNSASTSTTVDVPKVVIAAFGVNLTSESFSPTNGAVDIGETVGADFYLSNIGNVNSPLLSASLLSTNGVLTDPSTNTQALGIFQPGGAPLKAHFTFTATGTNGGTVAAVIRLLQGGNPATNPPVNFVFGLPNVFTFSSAAAVAIRDVNTALPYPSTLNISGVTGTVGNVAVTLSNISHGFPQDIDSLVSGPTGQKTILMSAAGAPPLEHVNVTFDDRAATAVPDLGGTIASTSYRPANYGDGSNLPAPAPAGPYPAAMSVFNGADPNGTWSLFVQDHSAGDTGSIAGGWSVAVTLISPVNKLADVALLASSSANPVLAGNNLIYTFTVTNRGPDAASNVRFSDTLPAGLTYVSSSTNVTLNGATVSGNLGSLAPHATAAVSLTATPGPSLSNPFANTASITAFEVDLNPANNTNTVVTGLTLPVSDLSLAVIPATNVVIAGSNITYSIIVSNAGPGNALNIAVTNVLPPGLSSITVSNPLGNFSLGGGLVSASIAKLTPSSAATITISGTAPGVAATLTNSASVVTASQDTTSTNNSASALVSVLAPAPGIVIAGVSLVSESLSPPNGAIDPGETVTVSFSLRNAGLANASSVTATLQASGGVTPIAPSQQSYGSLPAGGGAVANTFSFTANGINGGTLVTTLLITNGSTFLGTVTNAFAFPSIATFSNNAAIIIPDHGGGSPYPSVITVADMPGLLSKVKVSLVGFTHGFPRDVNALLVSPAGGSVLLMSHAGGPQAITNPITLTFDDAASNALPSTGPLTSGTNQPASYFNAVSFPAPAPGVPYGSALANLAGKDANGAWRLYVFDDSTGDAGLIGSGWSLQLTTLTTINPVADVTVGIASTPASLFVGGVYTNVITVSNSGPSSATGVMVTNSFPFGVSPLSIGNPPPGPLVVVPGGGSVTLSAGTLPAGAATNFSVVLVPSFGITSITNTVAVGANEADLYVANNTAQSLVSALVAAPAVLSGSVSNRQFELAVLAEANLRYIIQASTNLSTWVSLSTNTASAAGTIKYIDSTSPAPDARYYRAVRVLP